MSLRWECPLCSRRLWWFQKACRTCAAKVALAAFERMGIGPLIGLRGPSTLEEAKRWARGRKARWVRMEGGELKSTDIEPDEPN